MFIWNLLIAVPSYNSYYAPPDSSIVIAMADTTSIGVNVIILILVYETAIVSRLSL
jgi:hypothetical protein